MTDNYHLGEILLSYPSEREKLRAFLAENNLQYEPDLDMAYGIFDANENLVGCGCAARSLLKCFAVSEELRGQNALGTLLSALIENRFQRGYFDLFVITRREKATLFSSCGLRLLAETGALAMLENRPDGPERFAESVLAALPPHDQKTLGAIVMNCNPFTLGHRALVEYATAKVDLLCLFVVEENRSLFPTEVRFQLVKEGVKDLPNVHVFLSGPYMISGNTFPTYFLKAGEDAAALQCELDATLFAHCLAPKLGISVRFVGSEPLDPTTACYNRALREILPPAGILLDELPRRELGSEPISASRVRALLSEKGVCPEVLSLVPPVTAEWLNAHWNELAASKASS